MKSVITKLSKNDFTKNDVNELSKLYGANKTAFGRSGDILKSTNAQLFENVRTGLKGLAREGIDSTAETLDRGISEAIKTKKLIDTMSEKVNKEIQKANDVGLFKKAVGKVVDTADLLTGHIISNSLTRLAKTGSQGLSSKEIEAELAKNLKKLQGLVKNKDTVGINDFIRLEGANKPK